MKIMKSVQDDHICVRPTKRDWLVQMIHPVQRLMMMMITITITAILKVGFPNPKYANMLRFSYASTESLLQGGRGSQLGS